MLCFMQCLVFFTKVDYFNKRQNNNGFQVMVMMICFYSMVKVFVYNRLEHPQFRIIILLYNKDVPATRYRGGGVERAAWLVGRHWISRPAGRHGCWAALPYPPDCWAALSYPPGCWAALSYPPGCWAALSY